MKYWEIIADNLSKAGWSWGCVSAINSSGRKRFVVRADEKLTAFAELESAVGAEKLDGRQTLDLTFANPR